MIADEEQRIEDRLMDMALASGLVGTDSEAQMMVELGVVRADQLSDERWLITVNGRQEIVADIT